MKARKTIQNNVIQDKQDNPARWLVV